MVEGVREMNFFGWKFESEILSKYGHVIRRLILIPPDWIERKLNGETKSHKVPPIVKVFFLLVVGLSLASIGNIGTRAYFYHANLFSYITGACFALVVPASVYVAAHMRGLTSKGRAYTWAVAAFAALLSSFIQVKLYMTETDITLSTWLSGNIDIEALSFSAGIPFFEVLIASLAAMISDAHGRAMEQEEVERLAKEQQAKSKAEAEAKRSQSEADERAEREHQRQMEQQRQQIELRNLQAQQDQQLRIQEQAQLAEIEAKKHAVLAEAQAKAEAIRLAAEAKVERARTPKLATVDVRKQSERMEAKVAGNGKRADNEPESEYELMKRMIAIYQREPTASNRKVGDEIGVSHTTVADLLSNLASKEVVHIEKAGRGKTVTINGKLSAFLAGELA